MKAREYHRGREDRQDKSAAADNIRTQSLRARAKGHGAFLFLAHRFHIVLLMKLNHRST